MAVPWARCETPPSAELNSSASLPHSAAWLRCQTPPNDECSTPKTPRVSLALLLELTYPTIYRFTCV
eukprot:3797350-Pyramimonas_sp.AAC.3